MLDMYEHVYCTNCVYGNKLLEAIYFNTPLPKECENCFSFDPDDSKPFYLRKKYKEFNYE